jgi:hypothetical protein
MKKSLIGTDIPKLKTKKLRPNKTPIDLNKDLIILKATIKGKNKIRPKKAATHKNLASGEFERAALELNIGTETSK